MKHIVKVFRMKDQKVRIYALPANLDPISKGTLVKVDFRGTQKVYGEALTDSHVITDGEETLIKEMFGIEGEFARVRAVLTESPVDWETWDNGLDDLTNAIHVPSILSESADAAQDAAEGGDSDDE